MSSAELLIDAKGPDIRFKTGLTAPDAFMYLKEESGQETVFFDAREYDIQKKRLEALGSSIAIERLEPYLEHARKGTDSFTIPQRVLLAILTERGIDTVFVSPDLGYGWAKALLDAGKTVTITDVARVRRYKSETQLGLMIEAQRVTEGAYDLAREMLSASSIDGDRLLLEGNVLTSELLKARLKNYFAQRGYSCPEGMVVASGEQTARPHDDGSGPILPHQFIIIDLFPQSDASGFFADMTRTFVKGNATDEMKRLYQAVFEVQQEMVETAERGMRSDELYQSTIEAFKVRGYETSAEQGFMHRTGHGLGLSVHEDPSFLAGFPDPLEPGMVMTVEPGLYYPALGGARIEDVIIFHADGRKENITHYSKDLLIP